MIKKVIRTLLRLGSNQYQRLMYPKFLKIKREADGMLHSSVYKKMYDLVCHLPDMDIIEVGGASGAGSICVASAIKDSGKTSRLIVIEKCEGGSRIEKGDYGINLHLIEKNFKAFGVEDHIVLFPHEITLENGNEILPLIKTPNIAALILDADGRVDRDFYWFWPILKPGGLIVVDDYAERAKYLPITERRPTGGMKALITYRLLNQMIEWGLFRATCEKGDTVFGYKPEDADFERFDLQICEKIVERIELERTRHLQTNTGTSVRC